MKNVRKLLVVVIAAIVALSGGLVGCGGSSGNADLDDAGVLNIIMPDLGYGTDWMKAMAAGFTTKTGTKVNVDITPTESSYVTQMRAGTAKYDIYLLRDNTFNLVTNNAANYSGYDCILANYDDIFNSKVDGEDILFKDKMKSTFEIYNRVYPKYGVDEYHYYAVQWCDSAFSLVRNLDVWQSGWAIPNTTDELLSLAGTIKSQGYYPFIWSAQASYWWQSANLWITQYQGYDDMYGKYGFWNGYAEGASADSKISADMWMRDGIYYGLEVLDELVKASNGYQHPLSRSVDFTTAQGYFLTPSQKIAMMSNGDWLYKEMSKNYSNAHIEMIKMPVVSAIINHPDCENTIADDAELSALIKAIDGGSTALTGEGYSVSQKAFNKIYDARTMYTPASNINHVMVSPSYSDSLDIVKQFYLYMASDEGLKIYSESSGGFILEFETSDSVKQAALATANDFVKSTLNVKFNNKCAPWPVYSCRLFSIGGMSVYPTIETGYTYPELLFSIEGNGYMNANDLYLLNYQNAISKWSVYLQTAGMS